MKPQSYEDIMKSLSDALAAGPGLNQLQSGAALQIESIAAVMASVTFNGNTLKPWPYMKYPEEYQELLHFLAKLGVKIR